MSQTICDVTLISKCCVWHYLGCHTMTCHTNDVTSYIIVPMIIKHLNKIFYAYILCTTFIQMSQCDMWHKYIWKCHIQYHNNIQLHYNVHVLVTERMKPQEHHWHKLVVLNIYIYWLNPCWSFKCPSVDMMASTHLFLMYVLRVWFLHEKYCIFYKSMYRKTKHTLCRNLDNP